MGNMSEFIHLHTHSHYSLLDGLSKVEDLVELAKKFKMPALAITDHGNLYGAIEFYTLAKKAILYRPALNKIVDIGPVNMDENVSGASTSTKISSGSGRIIYRPISPSPAREEIDTSDSPALETTPR